MLHGWCQQHIPASRTRLGSQSLSRRNLMVLLPHTVDLDIENCMFCIVHQLLEKLQPDPLLFTAEIKETLRRCALERTKLCGPQSNA